MLDDLPCARDGCDRQTVYPAEAARRGWFVIVDRRGKTWVWCPEHATDDDKKAGARL